MEEYNDKIYVDTSHVEENLSSFIREYFDDIISATGQLKEKYSFKTFMFFLLKLYAPEEDEEFSTFSLKEICEDIGCPTEDELIPSLDELVEKKFLNREYNKDGQIVSFSFDINPSKGNKDE